jgi:Glycosyl hydrolases family 16
MIPHIMVAALCVLAPLSCVAHAGNTNGEAAYISFSVPGALGTYPMGINASMEVTGYYYASPTVVRGFLRGTDGTMTTFDVSGGVSTEPVSINDAGDVTGIALVGNFSFGFTRYADGRIVTFEKASGEAQALPVSINAFAEVAGNYQGGEASTTGFTRSRAGEFTTLEYPKGSFSPTAVTGLNASGTVVGFFAQDSSMIGTASFISNPDGFSTQFVVPVDVGNDGILATAAQSINADGTIVGWYSAVMSSQPGAIATTGGFVRSPQGIFTLFNPPGTIVTLPRTVFPLDRGSLSAPRWVSIDQAGDITGSYTDTAGVQHGFVRNPFGTITSFDPPRGGQTEATSINDSGVIAGSYFYDWNTQIAQGFLRLPRPSAAVTIAPPQAAGYSLAWQDTFSTLSLCSTNIVGCNWYDPGINGYPADGEITDPSNTYANLNWSSTQGSWYTNMSTASMNGAFYRSWTPPFYIEVSMAFNAVTGNWPALWLRPVQTIGDPYVNGGELDIFEWFSYAPTQGTGSIHVWQNSVDTNNGGSNRWAIPNGTVLNNYNTYGVLVTGTSVSWYFNNSLVETFSTTSAPYNTVYAGQESYFLIMSEQAGCGTGPGNCPGNTQTSPINMQVQWAHVFAGPLTTH